MVKIRLMRVGMKKRPIYRVVVADSHAPRDGRFIEIIGQYDPKPNPSEITVNEERALEWLSKGAQPTDQARALLKRTGIWSKHVAAHPTKVAKPRNRKPKAASAS